VKDPPGVDVVDGNHTLLIRYGEMFLFVVNSSTSHFLLLPGPQEKGGDLFLGLHGPDPHKEVAVDGKYLILVLHE